MVEPEQRIEVGIVVERRKSTSPWLDWVWQALAVLPDKPDIPAWRELSRDGERATYYAGPAEILLHRSEAANYRDNLATGNPQVWVVLQATDAEPPYEVSMVTADPAEGEAATESAGSLVEAVIMPAAIRTLVEAFVAEHLVERPFVKRTRDRADPEALARRAKEGDA